MSRVWFVDRNLGKRFPSLLAEAGLAVERHKDLVAQEDTPGPFPLWYPRA